MGVPLAWSACWGRPPLSTPQPAPASLAPPQVEVTDPRWGTFRQRGAALGGQPHGGIPILAFDVVSGASRATPGCSEDP